MDEHEYFGIHYARPDDSGAVTILCVCGWTAECENDSEADQALAEHIDFYETLREAQE